MMMYFYSASLSLLTLFNIVNAKFVIKISSCDKIIDCIKIFPNMTHNYILNYRNIKA